MKRAFLPLLLFMSLSACALANEQETCLAVNNELVAYPLKVRSVCCPVKGVISF